MLGNRLGPVAIVLMGLAIVSAFLRAHYAQQARRNREAPKREETTVHFGRADEERALVYTPEGERYLRRARLFRLLLYVSGLGALLAAWFRL